MSNPYFMGGSFGSLGPSIGQATGQNDKNVQALQGSMAMPQAYHSKPVAALPPAMPFQAGHAFGGPAPQQAAAMQDSNAAMYKGLTTAAQDIGKGFKAQQANQTRQGLLGDPLGVGMNGQTPMPDASGFTPDSFTAIGDAAQNLPPVDPNWFQGFNLGGFW